MDGNLKDAEVALDERRRRKRSGEPVAPERVRLADYAKSWLGGQTELRPRTIELYEMQLRNHVYPRLGRLWLHEVREDDVTGLIAEMRAAGYSASTIRGVLTPLTRLLNNAVRRRLLSSNPVTRLERGERPAAQEREQRILQTEEIGALLGAADAVHRPLIATAVFTGLRLGELLGLTWGDLDLDEGLVRVRKQLSRDGKRVAPKTAKAVRDVEMFAGLGRLLREHKERAFARGFAKATDYVFASAVGTPLHYRNVARRGLDPAMAAAKLDGDGRAHLRWHDLRHTFASLLIAQGGNVVFVSRQLGHASPSITTDVYGHLFDRAEHGRPMRDGLEAAFGNLLETGGGEQGRNRAHAGGGEIVDFQRKGD